MLEIRDIDVFYGNAQVLHGLSLTAKAGEILCLLGRNGAGKTTCMKAVMGLLPLRSGGVFLDGEEISQLAAHQVPVRGIGYIPQGRRLFSELSVAENLEIGLMVRGRGDDTRQRVLDIFPLLRERLGQAASTLSGGEQQMLATARALCIEPRVLMLDEPTEGLQPSMIAQIREVIKRMKDEGVCVILVEQRVEAILSVADRVAFIENGHSREIVDAKLLKKDKTLLQRYVGV